MSEEDYFADLPVVLSATRLSQSGKEAPVAISIIDRDMIEASGAVEIADLFRLVPGFQVGHNTGNDFYVTYHSYTEGFPRRLQVLVDGRSVYTPYLSHVEWSHLGIDVNDVEKIIVVRGPSAPAYGSNAFMGTINIITRDPTARGGFSVGALAGSARKRSGFLSYSFGDFNSLCKLKLSHSQDEGFAAVDDNARVDSMFFQGQNRLNANDNVRFNAGLSSGPTGVAADGGVTDPLRERDVRFYYGHLRWERVFASDHEFHLQFYHNYYDTIDEYKIGPLSAVLGVTPETIPQIFDGQPDQTIDFKLYDGTAVRTDLEFESIFKPHSDWRMVWGGGIRRDSLRAESALATTRYKNDNSQRLFANGEWKPRPKVLVNLGAMFEHNDLIKPYYSPRAALNYHAGAHETLRMAWSRSIRSPAIWEQHAHQESLFNDGSTIQIVRHSDGKLQPEKLQQFEVGFIANLPEQHAAFDIKAYREKLSRFITDAPDLTFPQPYPALGSAFVHINDRGAVIHGVELQWRSQPSHFDDFYLQYGYADIDGRILRSSNPDEYKTLDKVVPKNTVSVLYSRKWPNQFRISAAFYHMSDMEWLVPGGQVSSYQRYDLRMAKTLKWAEKKLTLAMICQNLLGDKYMEVSEDNRFTRRFYLQLSLPL